jgi:hypothetical protein
MPRWLGTSRMSVLGACWVHAYFLGDVIFGGKTQNEEKYNMKEKKHV